MITEVVVVADAGDDESPGLGPPASLRRALPRTQPDTSPQTLRIPDRSGHPVLHRLASLAGKALPLPLNTAPLIRALEGL
jgi:hypothetical protein